MLFFLPYFHYNIFRLLRSCSAFLPWWVFCIVALCWRLLTSSRNFLFPLTHPHIHTHTHTHSHAYAQSCCYCCCYMLIKKKRVRACMWNALCMHRSHQTEEESVCVLLCWVQKPHDYSDNEQTHIVICRRSIQINGRYLIYTNWSLGLWVTQLCLMHAHTRTH